MQRYFETKIRAHKDTGNGTEKAVTETFIFQSESFTECEKECLAQLSPYYNEVEIIAEKISNIAEILRAQEGPEAKWYKVKINFLIPDGNTGRMKKTPFYSLILADNIESAKAALDKSMKGEIADYQVVSVTETDITEVYENNSQVADEQPAAQTDD